jgi:hypothetical protein
MKNLTDMFTKVLLMHQVLFLMSNSLIHLLFRKFRPHKTSLQFFSIDIVKISAKKESTRTSKTLLIKMLIDFHGQDLKLLLSQTEARSPSLLLMLQPFIKETEKIFQRRTSMLRFTVLLTLWLIELTGIDHKSHLFLTDPR